MTWMGWLTAVASVVLGGVFFAFSSFVMPALGNLQPEEGIRAMQRINIDVFCGSFSALFFGLPVAFFGLGVSALVTLPPADSSYWVVGSVVYLVGCLLVTGLANVPLNNSLARLNSDAVGASAQWQSYVLVWTRWNHVRGLACLLAGLCYLVAGFGYLG